MRSTFIQGSSSTSSPSVSLQSSMVVACGRKPWVLAVPGNIKKVCSGRIVSRLCTIPLLIHNHGAGNRAKAENRFAFIEEEERSWGR